MNRNLPTAVSLPVGRSKGSELKRSCAAAPLVFLASAAKDALQARADVLAMAKKQPGAASDILIRQCSVEPQGREARAGR